MDAAVEAQDRGFHGDCEIWGGDIGPAAVELARHNAQLAEVDDIVRFEAADARTFHWGGMYGRTSPILPTASALWSAGRQRSCTAPSKGMDQVPGDLKLYSLSPSHTEFERTFGKIWDRKRKLYITEC